EEPIRRRAAPRRISPLGAEPRGSKPAFAGLDGRRGTASGGAAACKASRPAQRRSVGALFISERTHPGIVVGPARSHLDPQLQEHLATPEPLQLGAGLGADALELLALVADHHALVAVALDHD